MPLKHRTNAGVKRDRCCLNPLQYVQTAAPIDHVQEAPAVHLHVVARDAGMAGGRLGQEVGDLARRVGIGDVHDAEPVANQATGISVPVARSQGWWQPVNSGCGSPFTPGTWKVEMGTGWCSSVMSTSQRNDGGPGAVLATSSSAASMIRRPWSGNGSGS